ncbi:ROK family glucokinase [Lipingzhangella sp. LS1_29]|uniref:Glucokinase n=1 Tax=Lipingzhangella rawalii TaxID=2055835 RepID=A0ABU2H068_9ACTN|nr:ROK family glucokinase [Lipingzhangella rawalii]MDS1268701.1 ROK family glucokinase [Lipingzhangella rawalii]
MRLTIGVDVGGTKVAAGVVDTTGTVHRTVRQPTPSTEGPDAATEVVCAAIEELLGDPGLGAEVDGIGIGTPGFVDESRSVVTFAPNLPWREEPLRSRVHERFGLPVVVENDANAAAWAEVRFGAAQNASEVVCVTLGTGIGGGLVLGGEPYRGRFGIAAEIGHFQVVPNGRRCGCGKDGCWEQYASGRALVATARSLMDSVPERAVRLREQCGDDSQQLTGQDVMTAAQAGDAIALEAFAVVGAWAGQGIAALTAILDPEYVVLGGGVADGGEIIMDPMRAAFQRHVTGGSFRRLPELRQAQLGSAAGLVGAADLARR